MRAWKEPSLTLPLNSLGKLFRLWSIKRQKSITSGTRPWITNHKPCSQNSAIGKVLLSNRQQRELLMGMPTKRSKQAAMCLTFPITILTTTTIFVPKTTGATSLTMMTAAQEMLTVSRASRSDLSWPSLYSCPGTCSVASWTCSLSPSPFASSLPTSASRTLCIRAPSELLELAISFQLVIEKSSDQQGFSIWLIET